jgi:Uma2 family endonuclease
MSSIVDPELPQTVADLLRRLGRIAPRRVLLDPLPGTATERDLLDRHRRSGRLYELVEGTLVEKVIGYQESYLAALLIRLLGRFLDDNDLGCLTGSDSTMQLMPGLVRVPDVAFVRWEKLPGRAIPEEPIPALVPDLAIEVVSQGNTRGEMQRKLKEYFLAGTSLVWLVDPARRMVTVHTAPETGTVCREGEVLTGGTVLPGLTLPVERLFERLPAAGSGKRKKRDSSR